MGIKQTLKRIFSSDDEPSAPQFGDIFGEGDFIPNETGIVGMEDEQVVEQAHKKKELHWFITGMIEHIKQDVDIATGQYDKKRKKESDDRNAYEHFEQLAYGKKE
jgi:hypothetical protein